MIVGPWTVRSNGVVHRPRWTAAKTGPCGSVRRRRIPTRVTRSLAAGGRGRIATRITGSLTAGGRRRIPTRVTRSLRGGGRTRIPTRITGSLCAGGCSPRRIAGSLRAAGRRPGGMLRLSGSRRPSRMAGRRAAAIVGWRRSGPMGRRWRGSFLFVLLLLGQQSGSRGKDEGGERRTNPAAGDRYASLRLHGHSYAYGTLPDGRCKSARYQDE